MLPNKRDVDAVEKALGAIDHQWEMRKRVAAVLYGFTGNKTSPAVAARWAVAFADRVIAEAKRTAP